MVLRSASKVHAREHKGTSTGHSDGGGVRSALVGRSKVTRSEHKGAKMEHEGETRDASRFSKSWASLVVSDQTAAMGVAAKNRGSDAVAIVDLVQAIRIAKFC